MTDLPLGLGQNVERVHGSKRNARLPEAPAQVRRASLLTNTAEYALRAMAAVALAPLGVSVRAQDLAVDTHVPIHYLSKVLQRLTAAGLLVSQKGHQGGFRLARPASKIRFSEILAAVEQAGDAKHCAFGWPVCDPQNPCPLHTTWSQLNDAFRQWTQRSTLGDVRRQGSLRMPFAAK
jgi:Rrf2 family transcriptional regulator, iron-sulfur cluster assembly transcription factor